LKALDINLDGDMTAADAAFFAQSMARSGSGWCQ